MIREHAKRIVKIIKEEWLYWIFYWMKRYFIAYISYFLFKGTLELNFIKYIFNVIRVLYENIEKLYLTYYVSILFVVETLVYFLLGVLVESFIRGWIERSIHRKTQEVILSDVNIVIKKIFKLLVFKFKFVSIESLQSVKLSEKDEISVEDCNDLWRGTISSIKHVLVFFVLALITVLIEWNNLSTYWLVGIALAIIMIFCIGILVSFYVFISNLNKVFLLVESYAQTILRYDKKTNQ